MPVATETRWLERMTGHRNTPEPRFALYTAEPMEGVESNGPRELAMQLRAAFQFIRRQGDGRYSANSLMRLMNHADTLDALAETGSPVRPSDHPQVVAVEVPYEYDEETEVKTGGIMAMAVLLPDRRLMMAVHRDKRRQQVGRATYTFMARYSGVRNPTIWIHSENVDGQRFALSIGARPRRINSVGAVQYCVGYDDDGDDNLAVCESEDYIVEERLRQHTRVAGRSRRGRAARSMEMPPSLVRTPRIMRDNTRVLLERELVPDYPPQDPLPAPYESTPEACDCEDCMDHRIQTIDPDMERLLNEEEVIQRRTAGGWVDTTPMEF